MTKGDKIRNSTDEEIASLLHAFMTACIQEFVDDNRHIILGDLRMPSDEERNTEIRDLLDVLREEYNE